MRDLGACPRFRDYRKPEIIWPELVNQRLDMTEVNARWLGEYKKTHGLK